MKINHKGAAQMTTILAIAAIALLAWWFLGQKDTSGGTGGTTGGAGGTIQVCDVTKSVTVKLNCEDAFAPGTSCGSQLVYIQDGGVYKQLRSQQYSSGDTFSVAPGSKLRVFWAENSTTYYTKIVDYEIPCASDFVKSESIAPMQTAVLASTTVFNSNGQVITGSNGVAVASSNNQSIAAGENVQVRIRLKPTFRRYLGNPYDVPSDAKVEVAAGNTFSCRYNTSAYDSLNLLGTGVSETTNPDILPSGLLANNVWKSWAVPIAGTSLADKNTGVPSTDGLVFDLAIDSDDTANPDGTVDSAWNGGRGDIFCVINDWDFDRHAVTDQILAGPEDEDNNNLGDGTAPAGTYWNATVHVE